MATLVENVVKCHELLTAPRDIGVKDMIALMTANPETFDDRAVTAEDIAAKLRGYSRSECKRRGVSMSPHFDTPRCTLKWASVKMGRNDYEPVLIEWN